MANEKNAIQEVTGTITEVAPEVTKKIKFTRFMHKSAGKCKKYAPMALALGGAVGVIGTAYATYKSAKKLDELIEVHSNQKEYYLNEVDGDGKINNELIESLDARFKIDVAKTLAIPVISGLSSIVAIGASVYMYQHKIGNLTSAVAYLSAQSKMIHDNMVEKLGEEKTEELEDTSTYEDKVNNDGEKKRIYVGEGKPAPHGDWFSNSPEYMSDDMDYNRKFIQTVEDYANNKLFRNGSILLNDVRDRLGLERTRSGAVLGWTIGDTISLQGKVVNIEEDGDFTTKMFVAWTTPTPVYDLVDYNASSSGFGL